MMSIDIDIACVSGLVIICLVGSCSCLFADPFDVALLLWMCVNSYS